MIEDVDDITALVDGADKRKSGRNWSRPLQ